MIVSAIIFIVVLSVLILIHELGHFLVARRAGVKVEEFFLGFGPRLWSVKRGETEYGIKAVPLGGYVKMLGEDEDVNAPRSLTTLSKPKKTTIMVAGVVMNLLFGWLLFTILYLVGFNSVLLPGMAESGKVRVADPVAVQEVEKGSPADEEGIKPGDELVRIADKRVGSLSDAQIAIHEHLGEPTQIVVKRQGRWLEVTATPRENPGKDQGALGIVMEGGKIRADWQYAPIVAFEQTGRIAKLSAQGFGSFVKNLFVKQQVSEDVVGIVGIGAAIDPVRRAGVTYLLQFVALISISLAVINLVPIVPLDGGHVLITIVEAIRGKKLSDSQVQWAGVVGLAFIVLLGIVVTYKDILRFGIWERIVGIFS